MQCYRLRKNRERHSAADGSSAAKKKIGEISDVAQAQLEMLSVAQLEDLSEALLDFESLNDLEAWLEATH